MNRAYVRSDEHLNTFTVDTQLQSAFATGAVSHTLLTGVDYSRMRNDVDADYGTADPISMSNPQYGNPNIQVTFPYAVLNRMEQTGLYAQDQMEWDKWVMTTGGRYDYATTSTLTRSSNSGGESRPAVHGVAVSITCLITASLRISATANPSSRYRAPGLTASRSIRRVASSMKLA